MLSLLTVIPSLLWLIIAFRVPTLLPALSQTYQLVILSSVGLLFVLTLFFRQWRWGYWSIWLVGAYAALTTASNTQLPELKQALAVWLTVSAIALSSMPLPSMRSGRGLALSLLVLAVPFALLVPAISTAIAHINPGQLLTLPDWQQSHPQLGQWLWVFAVALIWATVLLYRSTSVFRWAQWNAWLALTGGLLVTTDSTLMSWALLASVVGFVFALADQLLKLAYIDELTGLPQRRALMSQLQHMPRRGAVCMLDVDHFKKFNDRYGHDVGDQVLRLLGRILRETRGLKAYRYGGEEFTLIFKHNDEERLEEQLEDVRLAVADYPLTLRDEQRPENKRQGKAKRGAQSSQKTVKVTISLGATVREKGDTPESLLKRADDNLYAAKKAGRNRAILK